MPRYRYCTPALTGPWRTTAKAALRDAVKAAQALFDDSAPSGVRWIVPGRVQEDRPEAGQGKPAARA